MKKTWQFDLSSWLIYFSEQFSCKTTAKTSGTEVFYKIEVFSFGDKNYL